MKLELHVNALLGSYKVSFIGNVKDIEKFGLLLKEFTRMLFKNYSCVNIRRYKPDGHLHIHIHNSWLSLPSCSYDLFLFNCIIILLKHITNIRNSHNKKNSLPTPAKSILKTEAEFRFYKERFRTCGKYQWINDVVKFV